MNRSTTREDAEDFYLNLIQTFLENIGKRSCYDGSREFIPIFHTPHRKCRRSPSAEARNLEYLAGMPSKAASSGREKTSLNPHPIGPCLSVTVFFYMVAIVIAELPIIYVTIYVVNRRFETDMMINR